MTNTFEAPCTWPPSHRRHRGEAILTAHSTPAQALFFMAHIYLSHPPIIAFLFHRLDTVLPKAARSEGMHGQSKAPGADQAGTDPVAKLGLDPQEGRVQLMVFNTFASIQVLSFRWRRLTVPLPRR